MSATAEDIARAIHDAHPKETLSQCRRYANAHITRMRQEEAQFIRAKRDAQQELTKEEHAMLSRYDKKDRQKERKLNEETPEQRDAKRQDKRALDYWKIGELQNVVRLPIPYYDGVHRDLAPLPRIPQVNERKRHVKRPLPLEFNAPGSHTVWDKDVVPGAAVPEATAVYQREDTLDILRTADMLAEAHQPQESPLTATTVNAANCVLPKAALLIQRIPERLLSNMIGEHHGHPSRRSTTQANWQVLKENHSNLSLFFDATRENLYATEGYFDIGKCLETLARHRPMHPPTIPCSRQYLQGIFGGFAIING